MEDEAGADDGALSAEEAALHARLARHAEGKPFRLNPDRAAVLRVLRGVLRWRTRKGTDFCPCRLPSGDAAKDAAIVCPCAFHEDEIRRDGHCHCYLYVAQ